MKKNLFLFSLLFLFSSLSESFGAAAVDQRSAKSLEEQLSQVKISESYGQAIETRKNLLEIPEKKKTIRDALKHASSQEFTGALEWAHRKGILGNGANVLIVEPLSSKEHADDVLSVVKMIAPQARLSLLRIFNTQPALVENTIINASFGASESAQDPHRTGGQIFFKLLAPRGLKSQNNFLIIAAGNSGKSLDFAQTGIQIKAFLDLVVSRKPSASVGKLPVIIVGSLQSNSDKASSSNSPGYSLLIQKRFLYTLGHDVYKRDKSSGFGTLRGTSFAAPAVSGAAALVLAAHPRFSMEEVANVLLESAEKNFFISSTGTFIYDPTDPETKSLMEARYPKAQIRSFDPHLYGRGILSLRRAFIYADIYEQLKKEMSETSVEETLPVATARFNQEIKRLDHVHAINIQKNFREWKERKRTKERNFERKGTTSHSLDDLSSEHQSIKHAIPLAPKYLSIEEAFGDDPLSYF